MKVCTRIINKKEGGGGGYESAIAPAWRVRKCNSAGLASPSTDIPHTLNYATSVAVGLRGSFQTPGVTRENLGLTFLPHFLDQH